MSRRAPLPCLSSSSPDSKALSHLLQCKETKLLKVLVPVQSNLLCRQMLLHTSLCRASRISPDSQSWSKSSRMSTFVLTLLTFWPPAPPLLAKFTCTSSAQQQKRDCQVVEFAAWRQCCLTPTFAYSFNNILWLAPRLYAVSPPGHLSRGLPPTACLALTYVPEYCSRR